MIAKNLHDLLRRELASSITVLLPEEAQKALQAAPMDAQGRPAVGQGTRGLGAFLQQHSDGFVQIGLPVGVGGEIQVRSWHPITTVAATAEACESLTQQVIRTLCGIPGRAPGPFRPQLYDPPKPSAPGVWSSTLTVQAVTLTAGGPLIPGA